MILCGGVLRGWLDVPYMVYSMTHTTGCGDQSRQAAQEPWYWQGPVCTGAILFRVNPGRADIACVTIVVASTMLLSVL